MPALTEPSALDEGLNGRLVGLDRVSRARPLEAEAPSPAVHVLVADGEALVRAGFRLLLEGDGRISVVAEAATGEEAVALAREVRPDVVLLDAGLPGLDSVDATSRMCAESGVPVMLLSATDDEDRLVAALRAGASGLLVKDAEPAELVLAVQTLARGEALLSPSLTRRLIAELVSRPQPVAPGSEVLDELTAREREVVALVGLGMSNDEIAERLVVSPATARTHVSRAMVKVHARDRAQLVVFAYESGLACARPAAEPPATRPLQLV